jgi:hypothetical protein
MEIICHNVVRKDTLNSCEIDLSETAPIPVNIIKYNDLEQVWDHLPLNVRHGPYVALLS